MRTYKLVLFDLDGTLLDTIADLAHSVNYALKQNDFPAHPIEAYNYFVGNGINKLIERALPDNERNEAGIARVREVFLPYYGQHNTKHTKPYEGIPELLQTLQAMDLKIAVASNKYQQATEKLIHFYFGDIRFVAVLGQRSHVPPKPDPTVVSEILHTAGVLPHEALYVGDSGVDMQTAANSNVRSVGVTWGFRPRAELETDGAYYIVDNPAQILNVILG